MRRSANWQSATATSCSRSSSLAGARYAPSADRTRCPVVAYGSNADPEVLRDASSRTSCRPVAADLRGRLRDFDVVYSAHVSP